MRTLNALLAIIGVAALCDAAQPYSNARVAVASANRTNEWHTEANGFGATVVITPDPNWKAKWGAPGPEVPRVERTSALRIGDKVWALVFLTNPRPDATGSANVTCDLRLVRPNGKISEHRELRALRGKLAGSAARTYLSEFVLTMTGEDSDPVGEWVVELVVHDRNRGVDVPIVGRYTLLPKTAPH